MKNADKYPKKNPFHNNEGDGKVIQIRIQNRKSQTVLPIGGPNHNISSDRWPQS